VLVTQYRIRGSISAGSHAALVPFKCTFGDIDHLLNIYKVDLMLQKSQCTVISAFRYCEA